ncbi:hypothetical protein KY284_008067 [Solanum tuberosum]|nr:hypothetical protein KY284_008067 [Solanum tuberosum]
MSCPVASKIWNHYGIALSNHDLHSTIKLLCCSKSHATIHNNLRVPMAILTPIILWKVRNNRIFNNTNPPNISSTTHISYHALEYYHTSYCPTQNPPRHMMPVAWHKPPEGHFKLNIDGSFDSKSLYGGTGGVITPADEESSTGIRPEGG